MKAEIEQYIAQIRESQSLLRRYLDWDTLVAKCDALNIQAEDPTLWEDQEKAQALLRERTAVQAQIDQLQGLEAECDDACVLAELGDEAGDEPSIVEAERALMRIAELYKTLETESLLSGEADANDCFIEIHAGAGGTESQDWADMLLRMYRRWAERRAFKVELVHEQEGEGAGIKSASIKITGHNAYGWAKTESGVHRLVRISPFDSNARRHTSFSSVWVSPVVDDNIVVDIQEKDLRIDTYRASGAGGQHVNRTDSAVRITHLPSGIVVQCQNDRSQHKNRAEAFSMLRSRLYERELQMREANAQALNSQKTDNGWGHQIRSYVLHPYQLVKDSRTAVETANTQGVLDGDISIFLSAALAQRVQGKHES
ncbi:MAG: peptide chain release factor 2 [Alphaproteobacteria bacterium]|nr:MAG: peptide chain release factor 2 [Alphaproteobacteria bacterium]